MITPEQCRAARALLDWTQTELADATKISAVTIGNFENGQISIRPSTAQLFRMTFEMAGIEFIDANGGGPGVRLKE